MKTKDCDGPSSSHRLPVFVYSGVLFYFIKVLACVVLIPMTCVALIPMTCVVLILARPFSLLSFFK